MPTKSEGFFYVASKSEHTRLAHSRVTLGARKKFTVFADGFFFHEEYPYSVAPIAAQRQPLEKKCGKPE
jgi:hypothetical protein